MKEHGVVGVVNMCVEWPGPQDAYAEAGIKQIRLPTVDTTAPSYTDLAAGIAFIKETLATSPDGSRIFIHCKAGRVRYAFFWGCFSLSFSITLSFLKFSFFALFLRACVRACIRVSMRACVRRLFRAIKTNMRVYFLHLYICQYTGTSRNNGYCVVCSAREFSRRSASDRACEKKGGQHSTCH